MIQQIAPVSKTPCLDKLHSFRWFQVPSQRHYEPEMFDITIDPEKYDLDKYVQKIALEWAEGQAKKVLDAVDFMTGPSTMVYIYKPLEVTYEPGATQFGLVWGFEIQKAHGILKP